MKTKLQVSHRGVFSLASQSIPVGFIDILVKDTEKTSYSIVT